MVAMTSRQRTMVEFRLALASSQSSGAVSSHVKARTPSSSRYSHEEANTSFKSPMYLRAGRDGGRKVKKDPTSKKERRARVCWAYARRKVEETIMQLLRTCCSVHLMRQSVLRARGGRGVVQHQRSEEVAKRANENNRILSTPTDACPFPRQRADKTRKTMSFGRLLYRRRWPNE